MNKNQIFLKEIKDGSICKYGGIEINTDKFTMMLCGTKNESNSQSIVPIPNNNFNPINNISPPIHLQRKPSFFSLERIQPQRIYYPNHKTQMQMAGSQNDSPISYPIERWNILKISWIELGTCINSNSSVDQPKILQWYNQASESWNRLPNPPTFQQLIQWQSQTMTNDAMQILTWFFQDKNCSDKIRPFLDWKA